MLFFQILKVVGRAITQAFVVTCFFFFVFDPLRVMNIKDVTHFFFRASSAEKKIQEDILSISSAVIAPSRWVFGVQSN